MAKKRKENAPLKLKHPDRSGPTEDTLLKLAQDRNLFEEAERKQRANKRKNTPGKDDEDDATISPHAEFILETSLWSVSLAMLHFTLDVFVQHQYAMTIAWNKVILRSLQALLVFAVLFYTLHAHPARPTFLPTALVPARFQNALRQVIFFSASVVAGCSLIHITNKYSYLAVLKQAPSLGCLWIWAVIELDLAWAALSLVVAGLFIWQGDYDIKVTR